MVKIVATFTPLASMDQGESSIDNCEGVVKMHDSYIRISLKLIFCVSFSDARQQHVRIRMT